MSDEPTLLGAKLTHQEAEPASGAAESKARSVADGFSVVIAGGGVAALEAALALSEHRGDDLSVELICPDSHYTLRPFAVNEPFGSDSPPTLDLADFSDELGIALRRDRLAEIWGRQRLLLDSGEDIFFDALLLAIGGRPHPVLPGAEVFRGSVDAPRFAELLMELEEGEIDSVAFAVPGEVRWSLPLYELALMTSHRLRKSGVSGVRLSLVTHENEPLGVFGAAGSKHVAELLEAAGVELLTGRIPERFDGDCLLLEDGESLPTSHVVALPALRVPDIPGLPQGRHGFIGTDAEMCVDGLDRVWAVGDASWFPIKQGGVAAQQAEVAAASILRSAGRDVPQPVFTPVIRGALLTGGQPEFLRAEVGSESPAAFAAAPLWWPPAKVAGSRLAPYLARMMSGEPGDPLIRLKDLEAPSAEGRADLERDHRDALELSLTSAELDAREGRLRQALRWLDVAEKLSVALPEKYVELRRRWREQIAMNGAT